MTQLFSRSATAGACVAMVGVGGLLAAYGPAIPELKDKFGLSDAAAGSGLAVQSVGAVVGVLAAQPVLRRRGNQFAVASSLLLICRRLVLDRGRTDLVTDLDRCRDRRTRFGRLRRFDHAALPDRTW